MKMYEIEAAPKFKLSRKPGPKIKFNATVVPSSLVKFSRPRRLIVAQYSNIQKYNIFSPLYDDDMVTVGFGIKSERTGKVVYFYLTDTVKMQDGTTVDHWIFKPIDKRKIAVKVVNDVLKK